MTSASLLMPEYHRTRPLHRNQIPRRAACSQDCDGILPVMAVTQQLARVEAAYLAACRTTAGTSSDGVPCWEPPSADVLDLDWAPRLLERVCELAELDAVHLNALRQATKGDCEIDLGFLNTNPHDIAPFGPPPTALSPTQVACLAELLGQIDMPAVLAGLPAGNGAAAAAIGPAAGQIVGGPQKYLLKHFNALREFYVDAGGGACSSCSGGTEPERRRE